MAQILATKGNGGNENMVRISKVYGISSNRNQSAATHRFCPPKAEVEGSNPFGSATYPNDKRWLFYFSPSPEAREDAERRNNMRRDCTSFAHAFADCLSSGSSRLWRPMQRCPVCHRGIIVAHHEHAPRRPWQALATQAGNKRRRQRGIPDVNRDGVVADRRKAGRGDHSAVSIAALVRPGVHGVDALAEPGGWDGDANPHRKPAFGG